MYRHAESTASATVADNFTSAATTTGDRREVLDQAEEPCPPGEPRPDCIGNYVPGLCDDKLIDFSVFKDSEERDRWTRMYQFRRDNLGLSPQKANEWTIRTIKQYYKAELGVVESSMIPIDPEFTLENRPLSAEEHERWLKNMQYRTEVLGLSEERAAKWTARTIEVARQLSASVRPNGLFDHHGVFGK